MPLVTSAAHTHTHVGSSQRHTHRLDHSICGISRSSSNDDSLVNVNVMAHVVVHSTVRRAQQVHLVPSSAPLKQHQQLSEGARVATYTAANKPPSTLLSPVEDAGGAWVTANGHISVVVDVNTASASVWSKGHGSTHSNGVVPDSRHHLLQEASRVCETRGHSDHHWQGCCFLPWRGRLEVQRPHLQGRRRLPAPQRNQTSHQQPGLSRAVW